MKHIIILFSVFCQLFYNSPAQAQIPIYGGHDIYHPEVGKQGMVSTQHYLATEVGIDILQSGGNAVDAAVAVGFALAVVLPRAGNIGGGGFMLVYLADQDTTLAIDYRERAPRLASRDMYLDEAGNVDKHAVNQSWLSIGVPGTVAGLVHAQANHGKLTLPEVMAPAIALATEGFEMSHSLATMLNFYSDHLSVCDATAEIFTREEGNFTKGDTLIQVDLSNSLRLIAEQGHEGFYKGKLARQIAEGVQAGGGIITEEDLADYQVNVLTPVKGTYKGHDIVSMPPPSSGGIHIIQILNMLEQSDLYSLGHNTAEYIHRLVEAMRLAYADRSKHLGDPKFWDNPTEGLTSKQYAANLASKINLTQATKSTTVLPGNPQAYEKNETTHFTVADKWGNLVSNTYTLNFSFGNGLMAPGTGILLNNEMGDFSAKPNVPDAYGLLGNDANAVEAMKTPLSSMCPTLVFKDGEPYLATGSPGGSRIITSVLQIILNTIEFDMNIAEATQASRIHHQWYPDILFHEHILNNDTRTLLEQKGHTLKVRNAIGSTQSIVLKNGMMYGASDTRRPDALTIGY